MSDSFPDAVIGQAADEATAKLHGVGERVCGMVFVVYLEAEDGKTRSAFAQMRGGNGQMAMDPRTLRRSTILVMDEGVARAEAGQIEPE